MPKPKVGNAKRYYCFTINNPTDNDDKQLRNLCSSDIVSYLCYGREGQDKTVHYQGYVELTKPQRFSWIKKRLTRAHLEPKKGSRTQARDYCFKEDSAPFEYGKWKPDKQGQRNDLIVVKRMLEDPSNRFRDIADEHFESFCKYHRFFSRYREWHTNQRMWETKVFVFHGPTGSGKTRAAFDMPFSKQLDYQHGFFEDPENHETLIFDDVSNPVRLFGRRLFLRMTDRYPMKVNIKGGHAEWNPKIIIFTTNDNPEDWRLDEACQRRISQYVDFGAKPHLNGAQPDGLSIATNGS